MQLGMIGLGRMGANMVRRLLKGGHQCVAFDRSTAVVEQLVKEKAVGAHSIAELAKKLTKPRAVWLMVPLRSWTRPSPTFSPISRKGTFSSTGATLTTWTI